MEIGAQVGADAWRYSGPPRSSCRALLDGCLTPIRGGANGGRAPGARAAVDARAARTVLLEELPEVVRRSLVPGGVDVDCARLHVETVEDADHLRRRLPELGLVAFVADGSICRARAGRATGR